MRKLMTRMRTRQRFESLHLVAAPTGLLRWQMAEQRVKRTTTSSDLPSRVPRDQERGVGRDAVDDASRAKAGAASYRLQCPPLLLLSKYSARIPAKNWQLATCSRRRCEAPLFSRSHSPASPSHSESSAAASPFRKRSASPPATPSPDLHSSDPEGPRQLPLHPVVHSHTQAAATPSPPSC